MGQADLGIFGECYSVAHRGVAWKVWLEAMMPPRMKYTRLREIIPICLICGTISGYAGFQAMRPSHVTAPPSAPVTHAVPAVRQQSGETPHDTAIHHYVIAKQTHSQTLEIPDDPRVIGFGVHSGTGRLRYGANDYTFEYAERDTPSKPDASADGQSLPPTGVVLRPGVLPP
jgi:hypothetical protein